MDIEYMYQVDDEHVFLTSEDAWEYALANGFDSICERVIKTCIQIGINTYQVTMVHGDTYIVQHF